MNEVCMFCKQPVKISLATDDEPVTGLRTGMGIGDWVIVHVSCLNTERDKHRKSLDESSRT
jgi:hydrogenase maturation factor